ALSVKIPKSTGTAPARAYVTRNIVESVTKVKVEFDVWLDQIDPNGKTAMMFSVLFGYYYVRYRISSTGDLVQSGYDDSLNNRDSNNDSPTADRVPTGRWAHVLFDIATPNVTMTLDGVLNASFKIASAFTGQAVINVGLDAVTAPSEAWSVRIDNVVI